MQQRSSPGFHYPAWVPLPTKGGTFSVHLLWGTLAMSACECPQTIRLHMLDKTHSPALEGGLPSCNTLIQKLHMISSF